MENSDSHKNAVILTKLSKWYVKNKLTRDVYNIKYNTNMDKWNALFTEDTTNNLLDIKIITYATSST